MAYAPDRPAEPPEVRLAPAAKKKLTSSLEDYLEAILHLIRRDRVARVRDIAARLGVGMPAVTAALKTLSKRGLVNYDPYQVITLTSHGREVAEKISRRHALLRQFLTGVLGMDSAAAEANACRMEHAADDELLERLRQFTQFLESCPRTGATWIEQFQRSCGAGREARECDECLHRALEALPKSEEVHR